MKRLFKLAQTGMAMDDGVWRRHANPWSVYSRMTLLPLLSLALWSRVWLGWWAMVPVVLCLVWTWVNPRLFPAPTAIDGWAAEGTVGERLFMTDEAPSASNHARAVALLTAANMVGAAIWAIGLIRLDPWLTLWGLTTTMGAKLWTFDRMVWLYREHRRSMRDPGERAAA